MERAAGLELGLHPFLATAVITGSSPGLEQGARGRAGKCARKQSQDSCVARV